MDKLGVITSFLFAIVVYNIPLLYGTVGEIVVEKAGSLNLGVEGIMAVGAIFGYMIGCFANSLAVGIVSAFVIGALCGLLFAFLTVSLQANQNITGLTLTTFGLGVYFFAGNLLKAIKWPVMGDYSGIVKGFSAIKIPGLSQIPVIGEGLFSHNIMVYLGIAIAVGMWFYLNKTSLGLKLRSVGENPGAADAVGINVKRIKYLHIMLGCGIMELCEDIRFTIGMKELYARRKETIERLFGTAKENHGFRYTQMYGKARMEMKAGLTFACMNLKKLARMQQRYELCEA